MPAYFLTLSLAYRSLKILSRYNTLIVRQIIIVGGGSAGWLTAGIIASRFKHSGTGVKEPSNLDGNNRAHTDVKVTLIESPDIPTIGVGEGTWPSMRTTLKDMGVSESDFIRECDVSLKQGTRFNGWVDDNTAHYHHPFMLPAGYGDINLAEYWHEFREQVSFGDAVNSQGIVSDKGLSAKQISTPEFAFNLNYGYHLDAGKFANFLRKHCIDNLGVKHISDHVSNVVNNDSGDIGHLVTKKNGLLNGDLFIDCTGFSARLIGQHYQIPLKSISDVLFNDRALAVQVPYQEDHNNANSCTWSSAQSCGWIWDIGLSSRRGVGYVFSSQHTSDEDALIELKSYLAPSVTGNSSDTIEPKVLSFKPGYRTQFWYKNCVAIGLSGGFVEPLEASALVLVETAAKAVANNLASSFDVMPLVAKQFNQKFDYHWQQIIDFLKLHYVLNKREDQAYWSDHLNSETIPDSLADSLEMWKFRAPWQEDAPRSDELFSSASFQYVLYGMGFKTQISPFERRDQTMLQQKAQQHFIENQKRTAQLLNSLPSNRELQEKISQYGFQRI